MTTVPAATNTELRVLSLHQPWASLVMLGVKRFETRPGPPNGDMRPEGVRAGVGGCPVNRGDIIGIASTQSTDVITAEGLTEGGWAYNYFGPEAEYQACWCFRTSDEGRRGHTILTGPGIDVEDEGSVMPLGALLGTVRVVDAYPIVGPIGPLATPEVVALDDGQLTLWWPSSGAPGDEADERDISDQRPFGEWTPGRWAIELADPVPTSERCPLCPDPASIGRVVASCTGCGRQRWYGLGPCDCGTPGPARCTVCDGRRSCEPIPVSGLQGVWRLTADRLRGKAVA